VKGLRKENTFYLACEFGRYAKVERQKRKLCPCLNSSVFLFFFCLPFSFVRTSVLQERPEEHCSVREVESFHNSSHHVELEDCFSLYTKDEKVRVHWGVKQISEQTSIITERFL